MSFQIQRGLFQFDFMDQCAILGVSIEAKPDEIRKQYHKIARRLHPDQLLGKNAEEKQKASQILSKLVNPAYKQLSSEKELAEYRLILSTVAKRVIKDWDEKKIKSENAKKLLLDRSNISMAYNSAINALGDQLYQNLDLALESIAEISEINMVYLLRIGGGNMAQTTSTPTQTQPVITQTQPVNTPKPNSQPANSTSNPTQSVPQPPKAPEPKIDVAEPYCRRAEEYINKQNYTNALIELRDAVKLDPNSSRVHALLGMVYLYQNQATSAKVHINRAIDINPQDQTAIKAKQMLDKPSGKKSSSGKTPGKKDDKSDDGITVFGIKIGGKKK
ncbi:MAG TPA: DnaJ domain-containing protein [Allocoleopsis sp.]